MRASSATLTRWRIPSGYAAILAVLSRDVRRVERLANENATISGEHGFPLWLRVLRRAAWLGSGAPGTRRRWHRSDAPRYCRGNRHRIARVSSLFISAWSPKLWRSPARSKRGSRSSTKPSPDQLSPARGGRTRNFTDCAATWCADCRDPIWISAERSFRAALSIAREQGTKGFELRAATSLARLLGDDGRREEARELLAPVYGSFTEGFDTADLKDAKALLDELT